MAWKAPWMRLKSLCPVLTGTPGEFLGVLVGINPVVLLLGGCVMSGRSEVNWGTGKLCGGSRAGAPVQPVLYRVPLPQGVLSPSLS